MEQAPKAVRALWMTPWVTSPGLTVALSDAQRDHLWALDAMVRGQEDIFGQSTAIRRWRFIGEYVVSDTMDVFDGDGQRMTTGFVPAGEAITVETYYNGTTRYAYYPTERDQYVKE